MAKEDKEEEKIEKRLEKIRSLTKGNKKDLSPVDDLKEPSKFQDTKISGIDEETLGNTVINLRKQVKDFDQRDEAKEYCKIELMKINIPSNKADEYSETIIKSDFDPLSKENKKLQNIEKKISSKEQEKPYNERGGGPYNEKSYKEPYNEKSYKEPKGKSYKEPIKRTYNEPYKESKPPYNEPKRSENPYREPYNEPYKEPQPKYKIVVDSAPMQDVHVGVDANIPLKGTKLKLQNYATVIGLDPKEKIVQDAAKVGGTFDAQANPVSGMLGFPNEAAARAWLKTELAAVNITDPGMVGDLTDLIIDHYFVESRKWISLDDWRNSSLKAENPVPFNIWRTTNYLATKLRENELTRRDQMRAGTTDYIGIQLDNARLDRDTAVDRNTYTVFYLELPGATTPDNHKDPDTEDGWYRFTASDKEGEATFDHWEITSFGGPADTAEIYDMIQTSGHGKDERTVRSMRQGVVTWWDKEVEIRLKGNVKLVAFYHQKSEFTDKYREQGSPGAPKRYQTGIKTPGSAAGKGAIGDAASSVFGRSGVRNRIGWDVKTRELKKDPFLLAAINKGKRLLNKYAKAEYSRIFTPTQRQSSIRANELETLENRARDARRALRKRITRQQRKEAGLGRFGLTRATDEDLVNIGKSLTSPAAGLNAADVQALTDASQTMEIYLKSREKFYEDFKKQTEADAAHLTNYLRSKSQTISIQLSRRYRMPVNSQDEEDLKQALDAYAVEIAENFIARGRTFGHALMRGLGIASRGLETGGAAFTNVFYNIFTFLLGPWTITSLFTLVLFYFTFIFVGYNVQILWIMPLIGAAITFLLNFSDTLRPLDWLTHIASGAIIGYSAALLLISLGAPNWNFIGGSNSSGFWIAWIVLGAIGLFQFYQTGGWKIVLQVGILVLVFSYIALGPYHAYYDQAITQIKAPIEVAYRQVSNAITDVWLLVTNPTEWYARQQLVNVRPERPLDYPKGVEFGSIEAMPPSVPQGQQFAMMAVIKNDGPIDASDVVVSYSCNSWCISKGVDKDSKEDLEKKLEENRGDKKIKDILDKETIDILRKDDGTSIYVKSSLKKGESDVVTLSPFVASSFPQDRGLTNFAKVGI
ncbi:hypothetical protein HYZ41_01370, partial [archaeon]|nr:hypothetical protein [archaeon]